MKKSLCFAALTAGTMLAGTGVAAGAEAPAVRPHTVGAGESLSSISQAELGTTDRWEEIYDLNRDRIAAPDLIAVGQVLDIPSVAEAVPAPPAQESAAPSDQSPAPSHTVTAGQNLSGISESTLGASERWVEIFAVNQSTIADPDVLHVGQVLEIPSAPVDVPADLLATLATPTAPPAAAASGGSTTVTGQSAGTQALPASGGGGANLAAIRACESGGDYGAVSPDGLYRGAYQFDVPTWQSVGGSGDPAAASAAEQDARARQLWNQRGSNPWPNCG